MRDITLLIVYSVISMVNIRLELLLSEYPAFKIRTSSLLSCIINAFRIHLRYIKAFIESKEVQWSTSLNESVISLVATIII